MPTSTSTYRGRGYAAEQTEVTSEVDHEFGFRAVKDCIHINDLHATILKPQGPDHTKLTYFFQGREQRLTYADEDHEFAARLLG